jgi:hypothetical protein
VNIIILMMMVNDTHNAAAQTPLQQPAGPGLSFAALNPGAA